MSKTKTTRYSTLQFKNTSPPRQQKRDKSPESSLTIGNMRRNTEMCRFILQNKVCPFGEICLYAHSSKELIVPTRDYGYIYRTKPCAFLLENKVCPYGNKCSFVHEGIAKPNLPPSTSTNSTSASQSQDKSSSQKINKSNSSNSNYHLQSGPFSIGKESLKQYNETNRRQPPSPELEAMILECSSSTQNQTAAHNTPTRAMNRPAKCNLQPPNNLWAKTEIDQVLNFRWTGDNLSTVSNFALNPVALFAKISLN